MSVQERTDIEFSGFADGRCLSSRSFQAGLGVVLVNADGELVIEVMPKSVWMDLCECRIHCTHSSEDLAIERRDRQRLAPSKALVMRDEQVRVSPGGSDLDADRKSTRLNSSQ